MLALEKGEHLKVPNVDMMRVRAFRLEPLGDGKGNLTIDGELIETGPIQACVQPRSVNFLVKQ